MVFHIIIHNRGISNRDIVLLSCSYSNFSIIIYYNIDYVHVCTVYNVYQLMVVKY